MNFRNNLNLLLKVLENGHPLKLVSGHTLMWSSEHEAPGFLATKSYSAEGNDIKHKQMLFQVDSDVAWAGVIMYARAISDEEIIKFAAMLKL